MRAFLAVEEDKICQIAATIPESRRSAVVSGILAYTAKASALLIEWASGVLASTSGEATADMLEDLLDASEEQLDRLLAVDPAAIGSDISRTRQELGTMVRRKAYTVATEHGPEAAGKLVKTKLGERYATQMQELNSDLARALEGVESKEEAKTALREVLADLSASLRMVVSMTELFGAASNPLMPKKERFEVIKGSVERMGPLFIKMMQTLANMKPVLTMMVPDLSNEESDVLFESLETLQDQVSPVPWSVVENTIESSLGKKVEDAFVWIDEEPLNAGSIGQAHRAKIEVEGKSGPEVRDVVVKVLRPGIDEAFDDTVRTTRLTLAIFSELLKLDANGSIFGDLKKEAEQKLPLLEQALDGFIESFRIETDFENEAGNLRAFADLLAPEPFVTVPDVYDTHTRGNVLTMQMVKGYNLSQWIERYDKSKKTPELAEKGGRFPEINDRAEVEDRAARFGEQSLGFAIVHSMEVSWGVTCVKVGLKGESDDGSSKECAIELFPSGSILAKDKDAVDQQLAIKKAKVWAEHAYGLPVESVSVEQQRGNSWRNRGYLITLDFGDRWQSPAKAFVNKRGQLKELTHAPDLSDSGVGGLRDRMRSIYAVQVAGGNIHGDLHKGNFFILPDGKTISLVDLGLTLELSNTDLKTPIRLLTGALMGSPKKMAAAMAAMCNLDDKEMRQEVETSLTEHYAHLCTELQESVKERGWMNRRTEVACELLKRSLEGLVKNGIALKPRFLHALKTSFSMFGNITALDRLGGGKNKVMRIFGNYYTKRTFAPVLGGTQRQQERKRLRVLGLEPT